MSEDRSWYVRCLVQLKEVLSGLAFVLWFGISAPFLFLRAFYPGYKPNPYHSPFEISIWPMIGFWILLSPATFVATNYASVLGENELLFVDIVLVANLVPFSFPFLLKWMGRF